MHPFDISKACSARQNISPSQDEDIPMTRVEDMNADRMQSISIADRAEAIVSKMCSLSLTPTPSKRPSHKRISHSTHHDESAPILEVVDGAGGILHIDDLR